jgi:hypothetical protein
MAPLFTDDGTHLPVWAINPVEHWPHVVVDAHKVHCGWHAIQLPACQKYLKTSRTIEKKKGLQAKQSLKRAPRAQI